MKHTELEQIEQEIAQNFDNIRAEVLLAEIRKTYPEADEQVHILNKGGFFRSFRRDVMGVDNFTYPNSLVVELSRNGLYDRLPEGLFHKGQTSGESHSRRRKRELEEEKNARMFFQPVENGIFSQRLEVEENHQQYLEKVYSLQDKFMERFWQTGSAVPKKHLNLFLKLLPYSYLIAGNIELTKLALGYILNEEVSIEKSFTEMEVDKELPGEPMSERLGINFSLAAQTLPVMVPKLEISIGPIDHRVLKKFINTEGIQDFITTFSRYFIPVEYVVESRILVSESANFELNDEIEPILGLSTRI